MLNSDSQAEILSRLTQLEKNFSERLSRLEEELTETRLLLPDIYRYGKLRALLETEQWKAADLETTRLMQEIAGNDLLTVCTPEDLTNFCCNGTRIIDRLWRKYSQDRFGFSIQIHKYHGFGGNLETLRAYNNEILCNLAQELGWYKKHRWLDIDEFDFSEPLASGSLPGYCWHSPYRPKTAHVFFMRLINCGL
jgi:hypothetical protein